MTKQEFYKSFIKVQKEGGQGLSGIVKLGNDPNIRVYLDELIEEGLVKACDTGGSIGHPESNIFYMPTKGYNVWEDEGTDGQHSRFKGRFLTFVRLYLGAMPQFPEEGRTENQKFIHPTMIDCVQHTNTMKEYVKWLERNEKALKEMLELDDLYTPAKIEFSEEELEWIKSRGWYKKNETIDKCIKNSNTKISVEKEKISLNKQLIDLYKKMPDGYESDLKKSLGEIDESEKSILLRKKLSAWADAHDKKLKIQDVI